jgi:hypothetical protein
LKKVELRKPKKLTFRSISKKHQNAFNNKEITGSQTIVKQLLSNRSKYEDAVKRANPNDAASV